MVSARRIEGPGQTRQATVAIAAAGEEAFQGTFELGHALAQLGQLALHVVEALVDVVGETVDAAVQLAALLADIAPQFAPVAPAAT